jgi:hypothetical protein
MQLWLLVMICLVTSGFVMFIMGIAAMADFWCLQVHHPLRGASSVFKSYTVSVSQSRFTTFTFSDPMAPRCIVLMRVAIVVGRRQALFVDGATMFSLSLVGK